MAGNPPRSSSQRLHCGTLAAEQTRQALHADVEGRRHVKRQHLGKNQPTHNGNTERLTHFRPRAGSEGQRQRRANCRQCRHHDRTESNQAGFDDRFLHTLLVTTAYSGGRIVPQYGMFYDWPGAIVFQPGVTFIRDPFRFITDYTRVEGAPTGAFGAVRDRDNVRFQVEYVF